MKTRSVLVAGGLAVALLLLLFLAVRSTAAPRLLRAGQLVQFDDFFFTAISSSRIGPGKAPSGELYLVKVQVQNRAVRVPFTFRPSSVRVKLDSTVMNPRLDLTKASDTTLAAGESRTFDLVYEGPRQGRNIDVQFETGSPLFEFLDAVLLGRALVRIPQ